MGRKTAGRGVTCGYALSRSRFVPDHGSDLGFRDPPGQCGSLNRFRKILDQALTSGIPKAQRSDQRDPWSMINGSWENQDQIPADPGQIHALTCEIPTDPYQIPRPPNQIPIRRDPVGIPGGIGMRHGDPSQGQAQGREGHDLMPTAPFLPSTPEPDVPRDHPWFCWCRSGGWTSGAMRWSPTNPGTPPVRFPPPAEDVAEGRAA